MYEDRQMAAGVMKWVGEGMTSPSGRDLGGTGTWWALSRFPWKGALGVGGLLPSCLFYQTPVHVHLKPLPLHARWNQAADEKWQSQLPQQPDHGGRMMMSKRRRIRRLQEAGTSQP